MNYNYCEELSSDCSVCEQFPVKGCSKLGVSGGWRQETSAIRYHCDFKNPKTRRHLECIKKFLAFWPERLTWDLKCGRWSPFPLARKLSCCPTTPQKWWVALRLGESGAKRQLYASAKMGCWLLHGWWKINWIIFESCQNYILQNRIAYSQTWILSFGKTDSHWDPVFPIAEIWSGGQLWPVLQKPLEEPHVFFLVHLSEGSWFKSFFEAVK